MGFGLR